MQINLQVEATIQKSRLMCDFGEACYLKHKDLLKDHLYFKINFIWKKIQK